MIRTKELPVGVFYLNNSSDNPDFCISIAEARKARKEGLGWSINHGNDIRLQGDELTEDAKEIITKSKWAARPSGTPAIGYVNVLQLI